MSLSDTIAAAKQATPQPRALFKTFYVWYDALPQEDQEALNEALLSPDVSTRQLFRALKVHEQVPFGDNAFYYYARTLKEENQA